MTIKGLEQEAQRIEGESSTMSAGKGMDSYSTEGYITDDMPEEHREATVPISELRKVRFEAAKYRKELQSLKAKLDEELKRTELTKSEEMEKLRTTAEKAEAEAKSLKGRVSRTTKESAIINAASVIGFYNPKDAASLIETGEIEVDENGNIDEEKVLELVKTLGESKPYLRKEQSKAYYGPTNPAPQQGNWPKPKLTNANQIEQLKLQSRELTKQGRIVEATKLFNLAWEMEHGLKRKNDG
jgi:ElaB/YqjD/DUF883 family membrane-anchored ribosome-binding protein